MTSGRRPAPADQLADAVHLALVDPRLPADIGVSLLRAVERYDHATGYDNRRACRRRRMRLAGAA